MLIAAPASGRRSTPTLQPSRAGGGACAKPARATISVKSPAASGGVPNIIMPTPSRASPVSACSNNVAVLARRTTIGSTVAIVDWDVHHGDGTQDTFYQRQDVFRVSLHEFPFYPGRVGRRRIR